MELKLPEGLPMPDGMSKPELLELLLTQEYGFPPEPPLSVHGEETGADAIGAEADLCGGEAILKHIRLTCRMTNGDFSFPVISVFPAKIEKTVPCFLLIGFGAALPDTLPLRKIVGRGYGLLYFCYTDITPDDGDFSAGLAALIFPEGRTESRQCGKLGLWAWAASRVADYALTLPFADPARLSLVGPSCWRAPWTSGSFVYSPTIPEPPARRCFGGTAARPSSGSGRPSHGGSVNSSPRPAPVKRTCPSTSIFSWRPMRRTGYMWPARRTIPGQIPRTNTSPAPPRTDISAKTPSPASSIPTASRCPARPFPADGSDTTCGPADTTSPPRTGCAS